jgi:hypothetical protein
VSLRDRRRAANFIGKWSARRPLRDFRHWRLAVFEGICPGSLWLGPGGLRRKSWRRGQFSARGRTLRRLIALWHAPDDVGLDHHVGRSADHQEVLDIIAAHEHEPPASIHRGSINDRESRHSPAIRIRAHPASTESADQPSRGSDQRENDDEGDEKPERLRHVIVPVKQHPLRMPDSRVVRRLPEEGIVR